MSLTSLIRAMPKVELHVHLEGGLRPATVLDLAQQHHVDLPVDTVEELHRWCSVSHFDDFVRVYLAISSCIRTPDDIERITRELLEDQAAQQIRYSEVTYTALTHYRFKGLAFADQLAAINRARAWAEATLNTTMGLILDVPRKLAAEDGLMVADWAISAMNDGVIAFGISGSEANYPASTAHAAFQRIRAAGLPLIAHAGETAGAASIREALSAGALRIGHGIRCLEDDDLVAYLHQQQVPLEVCPSSNVYLGLVDRLEDHPLPRLQAAGLYVTINSDDPLFFQTSLTNELLACSRVFGYHADDIETLLLNAVRATLLPPAQRAQLENDMRSEWQQLRHLYDI
ncbi:MAG: adenosine deaminase [Chloroflexaceae bacterium]|nr:adenosine deaminase [Chloroflexaceae bacterium]